MGPVIDVECLFIRWRVGAVAGCTGDLVLGMVRLVRPGMVCRVVPGIQEIVSPVLAHAGRTARAGILCPAIGIGPWYHVQ